MRRFVLLVVAGWVSAVAVAACPECIDTNSSACRHWGSGRAFFKWASDEDAGSSITLTAGNSCGVGGGEGGVAYIFAVNDTHRATCKNQAPCDDGLSSKGAVAVIKVTGNQKAYQNIFPGGLTFASDRVVCYDDKCFRDYVTASQIGCEYTLPLASPGNSRIALGVSVSGCDPEFNGGKFNISVKFYEVLGATNVPDKYTLLAATKGSITVRVNNSSDSDAINFKPDLRNGSSIADFKPLYRNYTLEGGQTDWRLKYRGQEWGNNCTSMEGWLSSSYCNNNPMCLVPDEQTFYKVKYPGYGSPVNGNPPYAGQGGWSTTQPNSSLAMLAMNGPDWLAYYLLTSSGLLENTVYMMHYDMGNLGIMYYRGEYYSGDFRRVRQIEYCPQGTNFGNGQILWTFCYDSQNRIQYIHNAIEDPNSSSDPNTPANATAYYNYQYVGTGNDPTVTYWTRPNTQSDWSQQPDRQWELEFDALDRAVKFQGGCTSGCGGSGSFEHIEYYQDYEDLITRQYNATPIQILDNEYEEIEYGHYESAGWIQIINDDFEYPNITAYNCQSQTGFLGWDFTGGNVELCYQNDRGEDSQILRLNNNTIGFGLNQEVNGVVAPEANYILSANIKPQDNHGSRFARIELYAVPESGLGVYLTAIDANEANFDPADWGNGVSVEWNSNDRPDLDFDDINNLYHFAIIIRGNYVDIDDIGLSTSLWIGDKPRPVIKRQQKANAQGNLVTTLQRQFNKNNYQILERQYVSANQCRVIQYDYDDETFTNLVKKTEWQNPATATTLPSDPCFITIYSNDANNITYLPGGRYADNERYDPNSGKIRLSYRRDLENDVNSVREVNTYVNLDTSELSPDWRIKTHTNAIGGVTEYEYESCGTAKLLWKKTDPQTAAGRLVTEFVYDDARRQTEEKKYKLGESNILLSRTVNHYNPVTGFLDWTRDDGYIPQGGYNSATTYYQYNSLGQVIRQTNPDGVKTGNSYGLGGQLVSEFTIAAGWDPNLPDSSLKLISQTRYTYTADGLIEKIGKYKTNGTFDYQSSIPEPADPNYWVITKNEYYPDGKQKKIIEDFGSSSANANLTTEYFYNLQGEVEKVIYPTGKWVKTIRDGRGLVTFEYTGHGTDTVVLETAYDYDADGNLKEQHNPDGTSQFYTYNNFGQVKRVYQEDPNNGPYTEKFYDIAGNVNRELSVDSDGTLLRDILRRYDTKGNLEMERLCAEPNVVNDADDKVTWYKYDVLGNLQYTVQDGPGCSDPNSIGDPNNIVTEYIYDGLGRRQQTLSPVGVLSSVFYTPGGLPEQIVDPNDPQEPNDFITENFYDAAGRLERTVDPEGHYTINTYNSLNQLTKQTVFDCNETPDNTANDFAVRQTRTQYDNLSNVIRQVVMKNPASQANPVVGEDMITDYVYDCATGLLYQTKTWYGANPTLAVTTYDYDDIGRKISTLDPEGNEGHIVYSEDTPALVEKTQRLENNPGGNDYTITTFFDYDDFGRLWKQILDSNGNGDKDYSSDTTTTYLYDGLGRVTNEIAPDEVVTFTDYDGFGNVWQKIEDYYPQNSEYFNKTTEYVFNRLNRLSQIKAYDPNDTTSQVSIQTTTYEYDKTGAVTKITYPDNNSVEYMYNIQNKLDTEIQRNGKWLAYWYDQKRNLIQVSDYDQNDPNWPTGGSATFIETFSYDAAGNLKTADKVEGENPISHSEFTYNGFGLKTSETATYFELEPVVTTWDYDGSGNLISQSSTAALGCDLAYTHDGLGRIKTIDRNEERIISYSYIGTATKAIEYPEPQVTQSYSYDELGRVDGVGSIDGQDATILDFVYDYDEVGNRQSEEYHHLDTPVWDKFYYDNLRRLNQADYAADSPFAFAVEQPDSGSNRLVYLASLVLQWLDDGSIIATGTADNRKENNYNITSVSSVNSEAKVLTLAEFGTSPEINPKVRTETIYDDNGRLSAQIIYDANGNIILFAIYLDDSGKVVITSYYDTSGIMTSNVCTTYDAKGNVISREDIPIVTEAIDNNVLTPSVSSVNSVADTSVFSEADLWLMEADLLYSDGGMMLMSAPSGPSSRSQVFTYDHLGNRYQVENNYGFLISTDTYVHNNVNQYQTKTTEDAWSGSSEYTMQHDDNGNLTDDGYGNSYDYDYRNRLVSITDGENTIAEYVYDALGRRIAKTVGDTTTYFYYDTDNRVMTQYVQVQSQDVQPDRTFVYGNGITEVLAMFLPQYDIGEEDFQQFLAFCAAWLSETGHANYDDTLDVVDDNKIDFKDFAVFAAQWGPFPSNVESHFYYLTDALGSVRGLIGGKFNREEDQEFYNYDVYGSTTDTSVVGNPFMFAGYRYDTESGFYLLQKRSYDPVTGRFLQFDPTGYADSMNLYEYAMANPIMFTDPTGESVCSTRAEARQKAIEDVERKAYREPDNSWHLDSSKWGQGSCAEAVYTKLKRDCKPAEISKKDSEELEVWEKSKNLSGPVNKFDFTPINSEITNGRNPSLPILPGTAWKYIDSRSIGGGTRMPVTNPGNPSYNDSVLNPRGGTFKSTLNMAQMYRVTWEVTSLWEMQQYFKGFYRAKKECTTETLLKIVLSGGGVINKSGGKNDESFISAKFRFKEKGSGVRPEWITDSVTNYGFKPALGSEIWMSRPQ
jgi:RHS repeat-associated protein